MRVRIATETWAKLRPGGLSFYALLNEAVKLSGQKTKRETIDAALT